MAEGSKQTPATARQPGLAVGLLAVLGLAAGAGVWFWPDKSSSKVEIPDEIPIPRAGPRPAVSGGFLEIAMVAKERLFSAIALSPDGKRLYSNQFEGIIDLWNLEQGVSRPWKETTRGEPGRSLLAIQQADQQALVLESPLPVPLLRCWQRGQAKPVWEFDFVPKGWALSACLAPDNSFLLTGGLELAMFPGPEVIREKEHLVVKGFPNASATQRFMLVTDKARPYIQNQHESFHSHHATVRVWDVEKKSIRHTIVDEPSTVVPLVCLSADGKQALIVKHQASQTMQTVQPQPGKTVLELWDPHQAKLLRTLELPPVETSTSAFARFCAIFSPDGKELLIAWDSELHLWDTASGHHVRRLASDLNLPVNCLAFSPDSTLVFAGSSGSLDVRTRKNASNLRLWEFPDGQEKPLDKAAGNSSMAAQFLMNGNHLLCAGSGLKIWDTHSGELIQTLSQ